MRHEETRPPASAAARAPRAATQPRRRAWLRIFVVRYGLPCDPSGWGSFMQRGMIPRFEPLVVSGGKAQSEQMFSGLPPKADLPILELLLPPALSERRHRGLASSLHGRASASQSVCFASPRSVFLITALSFV